MSSIKYKNGTAWKNLLPSDLGWIFETNWTNLSNGVTSASSTHPTILSGKVRSWGGCAEIIVVWRSLFSQYWQVSDAITLPSKYCPIMDFDSTVAQAPTQYNYRAWLSFKTTGRLVLTTHGPALSSLSAETNFHIVYPIKNTLMS